MEYIHVEHPFPPLYSPDSRVLILGSFPSVKSREQLFFYGHPQNRFWKVIAAEFSAPVPQTIEEKKSLILRSGLALWDVIASCDIKGSSDSSIKNVLPTDLKGLLPQTKIERIFVNGRKAAELYRKYQEPLTGIPAVTLPSTSPANAAFSLKRLIEAWQIIRPERKL